MLKVENTKNGFVKVGNLKTEFKKDAIKKLSFEEFSKTFAKHGIPNIADVYEAITGTKVKKTKSTPASKRK